MAREIGTSFLFLPACLPNEGSQRGDTTQFYFESHWRVRERAEKDCQKRKIATSVDNK